MSIDDGLIIRDYTNRKFYVETYIYQLGIYQLRK